MYDKAYGIIETLAPLHVGATAGEETGNLNLIFRDQFTQTGIVPGSSIRGRLRAEMREFAPKKDEAAKYWYGQAADREKNNEDFESRLKIEHASIVWMPVFCPGQPIVWVSCPRLLERYQRIAAIDQNMKTPKPYTASKGLKGRELKDSTARKKVGGKEVLFFNLGFISIENPNQDLSAWFPLGKDLPAVVVKNEEMGMIHDMGLYRQSRVALKEDQKVVADKAFFNVEALPEGTLMVFPIGIKKRNSDEKWQPLETGTEGDIYLGGLESVGFGHCHLTVKGL